MPEQAHDAGPPDARGEALLALLVGGATSAADLALASGATSEAAEALAATLVAAGDVERRRGDRLVLTDAGRAGAAAVLEAERAGLAELAAAAMAAFAPLDQRVKRAITAWQVRTVGSVAVANDHRDARRDAAVLAELAEAVAALATRLRPLAERRPRFARACSRLVAAAARARAGEIAFVCGLDVDSVHGLWWRLHGELLALVGRTRDAAP